MTTIITDQKLNELALDESELVRSIFNESLWHAFVYCWPVINQSDKLVPTWYLKFVADEIEKVCRRAFLNEPKLYDLIINIPPGTGKSSLMAIVKAWCFSQMPGIRVLYASYAHSLAVRLNVKTRDILQSEWFQAAFPEVRIRDDQNTKGLFQTTAGGESLAAGVDGMLTGFHGHILFWDDLLNPKEATSEASLLACQLFDEETYPSRALNKEVSPIIGIQQRLHQLDSTGRAIERAKRYGATPVRVITLPADLDYPVSPPELKDFYVGGLLDPVRFPQKVLDAQKATNIIAYAGQYGQQPVPKEGGMFRVDRVKKVHAIPEGVTRWVRYWDKAGSKRKKSAWSVGVKMGVKEWVQVLNGVAITRREFIVADVVRFQERAGQREKIIHTTAIQDGPGVQVWIEQEPGSGGLDSAEMTIASLAGFSCRAEVPTEDKVARADGFASQMDIFNVFVVMADWNEEYLNELKFFPNGVWKDQVDASSGAFRKLNQSNVVWGAVG